MLGQWTDPRGSASGVYPLSLPQVSASNPHLQPIGGSREAAAIEGAVPEVPQGSSGRSLGRPHLHSLQVRLLPVPGVRHAVHGILALTVLRSRVSVNHPIGKVLAELNHKAPHHFL